MKQGNSIQNAPIIPGMTICSFAGLCSCLDGITTISFPYGHPLQGNFPSSPDFEN
jgi:hypothetical protein